MVDVKYTIALLMSFDPDLMDIRPKSWALLTSKCAPK
jgi:hypothetical protein